MANIHIIDLNFLGVDHAIAAFLIEGPQGLSLVECGPHSTFAQLKQGVEALGFSLADVRQLFLSHIHFDHAGAAWALAENGTTVYVHPRGLPHMASPEKLYGSARQIYGEQMDMLWGAMQPIAEGQLYAPQHGEILDAGGIAMTAWYTPGHAVHHIAWQLGTGEEAVLFAGDVAGVRIVEGVVVPPCPPPDINIEDWQQSIQLMRELPVETLMLTHYGVVGHKQKHLNLLEKMLLEWAAWMRPYAEKRIPEPEIHEPFTAYVNNMLRANGVDDHGLQQYNVANPAFMSVTGLMRYWKKRLG
jgi:glyoxylase-like metal-dependent hydrolase (beta-lactamase superfamily II)